MEEQLIVGASNFGRRRFVSLVSLLVSVLGLAVLAGPAAAAPPANDAFASAQVLTGDPANASGTTVDATRQSGEPSHGDSDATGTVWFEWTAVDAGPVLIDACPEGDDGDFVAALGVYTGTQVNSLSLVETGYCRTIFQADSGTTYRIAIASYPDWMGAFAIEIGSFDPPENDSFASAIEVNGATVTGSTLGATTEPGEPIHGEDEAEASVWFRWTSPQTGTAVLDACGGDGAVQALAAYTGTEVGSLAQLDSGYCRVHFSATSGTTYYVAVATYPSEGGEFELSFEVATPPANDDFANSEAITNSNNFPVNGTTVGATSEPGEPDHAQSGAIASVWYRVSFANAGTYVLDACDENLDTVQAIAVYQGSSVNALAERGSGYCRATIQLAASTQYRILVASYPGDWGAFTLKARYYPIPANDSFASPTALSETVDLNGHIYGATKQSGEPSHANSQGEASVWYSFSPSQTGTATISVCASFDGVIAVYTGSSVNQLTEVASDDDTEFSACTGGYPSQVTFPVETGITYRVAVDGYDEYEAGTFGIRTRLVPGPAQRRLDVNLAGTGEGTVSSSPSGISCGTACSKNFEDGTAVTLTASAEPGSQFTGWSGACSGTGSCVVNMTQAREVTANFAYVPPKRNLNVTVDGPGTVASTPAGIDCGSTCSAQFNQGTKVTLNAVSKPGATFTGWSGACADSGACVVDMSSDVQVRATFSPIPSNPSLGSPSLTPMVSAVKAGKRAVVKVDIPSIGDTAVENPKLCVEVPASLKKSIKKPGCLATGSIAPGSSWKATLRLQTTAKAKGKIRLKVTVTSLNAPTRTSWLVLKVKPKPKPKRR